MNAHRTRRLRHFGLVAGLVAAALVAASCGDDRASSGAPVATTSPPSTTTSPADTSTTTQTTTTATTPSTSAAAPVEPIPVVDPETIPDLVARWAAADATPGTLARDILGFPVDVDTPAGTSPHAMSLRMRGPDPTQDWRWEWSFDATTDALPGDIDTTAPDNGAGAVALQEMYDPVMAELGWSRTGSTASDPGDPGGPNAVNHVYRFDGDTWLLGEIAATPEPLFVWADEELVFGQGVPGYTIEVAMAAQSNFIPVPMLDTMFGQVPVAPGAVLTRVDVRTGERAPDAFGAEYGTRYLEVEYECDLLDNSARAAEEVYRVGLEGSIYRPGSVDLADPTRLRPEPPTTNGDTWTQKVIVLDRYPGEITVTADPATGEVTSVVRMRLEPDRPVLQPLG